ncbi:dipeptidase [Aquibacillus albus]|uniref:Membrane dipeptidase n=1 Tax=Aquibacillus albus TaxID=1168171 RepID=A0ABS2N1X2_9BACI|nr:dipeptidase [Aquibacillus albus]MBM7572101.1 membrane dipeptidase [Aquibacillus albus]
MIIDAHCDALLKLWENNISFYDSEELQVNYVKWKQSSVKVQCFAIFVPDDVPEEAQFRVALEMVDLFYEQVIAPYDDITFISSREDLLSLKENERGAILTLEGCHAIGRDLSKLKALIRLGVRAVGLTWNQSNAVADGIGEKRGAGLSEFGEQVVKCLNEQTIWTDVSHLSYEGFFDVMKLADYPMASHSNASQICSHRRNLDDKQIKALIERKGWIGVTFVPYFLSDQETVTQQDVIKHINYYLDKGAENCLGFGSDFDGTDRFVLGLYDYLEYDSFVHQLRNSVSSDLLKKICYQNFVDKFPRKLG